MSSESQPTVGNWERRVVPVCAACQRFFWKLAWFMVFLAIMFGNRVPFLPRSQRTEEGAAVVRPQEREDDAAKPCPARNCLAAPCLVSPDQDMPSLGTDSVSNGNRADQPAAPAEAPRQ